jgi:hypothetical protein
VTTDQLLAILNDDATRLGALPVTKRMLRDWVDESLIMPRTAKGRTRALNPIWHFAESDVRWARRIVELKAANIHRVAELRLHLWVSDDTYPIEAVPEALRSEFERLMHRDRRSLHFKYDHRDQPQPTEEEQKGHAKQLPPLDRSLAEANLEIPPAIMLKIVSSLIWGNAGDSALSTTDEGVNDILEQGNLGDISGAFGAKDEIAGSGEEQLTHLQYDDLCQGRCRLNAIKARLQAAQSSSSESGDPQAKERAIALKMAIGSFNRTEWIVSTLAAFALAAFRARTSEKPRQAFRNNSHSTLPSRRCR